MKWKLFLLLPVLGGAALAAAGLLLVIAGGWKADGPVTPLAAVGGALSLLHVEFHRSWLPFLEQMIESSGSAAVNVAVIFLVAALDWAAVIFALVWIGLCLFSVPERARSRARARFQ